MKRRTLISGIVIFLVGLATGSGTVFGGSAVFINRIEGTVWDPNRVGVSNAYVELLNDVESVINRTRTTGAGRFTFSGMPPGRFFVKVIPIGTPYLEQSQEVQITQATRTSGDTAYVDIYLKRDMRAGEGARTGPREVLFAQDVPAAAQKLYQDGVEDLSRRPEKAVLKLEEAVKVFPTYFDALHELGKAYNVLKNYEKAYPFLIRAIDINPRSHTAYYSLGYAFYQLKQYPAAVEAARATTVLAPESMDAQLLFGTLLRINGKFPDAEKALAKANTLAKGANGDVHWQLALLYNRLNRNQETVTELETFLKLVPSTPDKKKIEEMISKLKVK